MDNYTRPWIYYCYNLDSRVLLLSYMEAKDPKALAALGWKRKQSEFMAKDDCGEGILITVFFGIFSPALNYQLASPLK